MRRMMGLSIAGLILNVMFVSSASAADGKRIVNRNSGQCLAAQSGWGERPVIGVFCDHFDDQGWEFPPLIGGVFQIRNTNNGLCMVARGSGEALVFATTCDANYSDQLWSWSSGRYRNLASGLCLALRGSAWGTQAVQTTCDNGNLQWPDQYWYLSNGW